MITKTLTLVALLLAVHAAPATAQTTQEALGPWLQRCGVAPPNGDCVRLPLPKDGRDGRDGRDGLDGRDGRDGAPAPVGPRTLRPFDLGLHGVNFAVRAAVSDGARAYLLVYEPSARAAALVDPTTGLAQVVMPFDAGIGPDAQGRTITFDDVTVLSPRSFAWWHRGAVWVHTWDEQLAWLPLPAGLFRWR